MAVKWQAALQDEIKPLLPIHRGDGWIRALYSDNTWHKVNLETALKESHKIVRLELKNSSATSALYRILLSIAYEQWNDFNVSNHDDWDEKRLEMYESNKGFSSDWVEDYFTRFSDRFFLLHPQTPFLGDLSLYFTYRADTKEKFRANIAKACKPVDRQDPLLIKRAVTEKEPLALWGLPNESHFSTEQTEGEKIYQLISSLLYIRYSTTPVPRGYRLFFDGTKNTKTASKIHTFRCAVHYLPESGSLFRDLLLAMKYVETIEGDTPEWERDIDPETGLLEHLGRNVTYNDLVLSLNSPRSSVNITNHGGFYIPEAGMDNGGDIRYVWGVPFDNDGKDISCPEHWNPYVAWWKGKPDEGRRAVKVVEYMSANSFFGSPSSKVIYTSKTETLVKPEILNAWKDENLREVFKETQFPKLRILIFGGDAAQDKTYCDFNLLTHDYVDELNPQERIFLDDWIILGEKIKYFIELSLSDKVGDFNNEVTSNINISSSFWENYNRIFQASLNEGLKSPKDYTKDIIDVANDIFTDATYLKHSDPFQYAGRLNFLNLCIRKQVKGM